jgi:hypothetical protein
VAHAARTGLKIRRIKHDRNPHESGGSSTAPNPAIAWIPRFREDDNSGCELPDIGSLPSRD